VKQNPSSNKIDAHLRQDEDKLKHKDQVNEWYVLVRDSEIDHGLKEEREKELNNASKDYS